jgi:hypothetical protein
MQTLTEILKKIWSTKGRKTRIYETLKKQKYKQIKKTAEFMRRQTAKVVNFSESKKKVLNDSKGFLLLW